MWGESRDHGGPQARGHCEDFGFTWGDMRIHCRVLSTEVMCCDLFEKIFLAAVDLGYCINPGER